MEGEILHRCVIKTEVIMSTALNLICENRPGVLRDIAGVVASLGGNIEYTQQFVLERGVNRGKATVYMEIDQLARGMVSTLILSPRRLWRSASLTAPTAAWATWAPPPMMITLEP